MHAFNESNFGSHFYYNSSILVFLSPFTARYFLLIGQEKVPKKMATLDAFPLRFAYLTERFSNATSCRGENHAHFPVRTTLCQILAILMSHPKGLVPSITSFEHDAPSFVKEG